MWTIIGIASAAVGAYLVYTVLVKKFPQLKLIDLTTLAKERHAEAKSRIIKNRFERSLGELNGKTRTLFGRLKERLGGGFDRWQGALKHLEQGIEQKTPKSPEALSGRVGRLLAEAEKCAGEERWEEAEKRYIEILKLDAKNIGASRGLAGVYLNQRLYDQARETLEYLVRLDPADSHRVELGRLYLAGGELPKAFEQFRTAVQAEPYNPKYLDYFLETSILLGDAKTAEEALGGLEAINPDNAKLPEFRQRIESLKTTPS